MKITGRNIKRRLYGLSNLPSRIKRARHFRGHGVHSPFVYAIVRQVFMCSGFLNEERDVYNALLSQGIAKRRARELQNLVVHCKYGVVGVDCPIDEFVKSDMVVVTTDVATESLQSLAQAATEAKITLCIMSPSLDRERDDACKAIVKEHRCTSIDNRGYLLLFNNYLPKQIFRL